MSEVNQVYPEEGPALSGEDSVTDPVHIERTPSAILSLVPLDAKCFKGGEDEMTIQEWLAHTSIWMNYVEIPQDQWTNVAATLLREKALIFWSERVTPWRVRPWSHSKDIMTHKYMFYSRTILWKRVACRFHQKLGESAQADTERFTSEIINKCPWAITDRECRDIYANGLHWWYEVSELVKVNKTFDEIKWTVLEIDGDLAEDDDQPKNIEEDEDPEENPIDDSDQD